MWIWIPNSGCLDWWQVVLSAGPSGQSPESMFLVPSYYIVKTELLFVLPGLSSWLRSLLSKVKGGKEASTCVDTSHSCGDNRHSNSAPKARVLHGLPRSNSGGKKLFSRQHLVRHLPLSHTQTIHKGNKFLVPQKLCTWVPGEGSTNLPPEMV